MSRYLLIFIALLSIATLAHAEDPQNHRGTVRGTVFSYECKQVNAMALGFTCEFKNGQLTMVAHERLDAMSPDRRERSEYEHGKITLRYMELGGQQYIERADHWPNNKQLVCYQVDNLPYKIACADIKPED